MFRERMDPWRVHPSDQGEKRFSAVESRETLIVAESFASREGSCDKSDVMSESSVSSENNAETTTDDNPRISVQEVEPGPGEAPAAPKSSNSVGLEPVNVTSVPAKSWPPKTVGDLMTRQLVTLREDEPVGDLERWMEQLRFHHLPVIDVQMRLVGLITRTDLLHAMVDGAHGVNVDGGTPAGLIMRRLVVTAKPDYSLTEAVRVMLKEKLSCLPVVNDEKTLVGIVTNTDFVRFALEMLEK